MASDAAGAPDILSPEFAADPYPAYEVLRSDFPLLWHEATRSHVISRYADVERALKDPVFTNRNYDWQLEPVHGRTILQMDGREHAAKRALVTPAFRGRALADRFMPVIERVGDELIGAFAADGRVDLVEGFSTRFPIRVIVDMLGLPPGDHELFHRWYTAIVAFISNLAQDPEVAEAGLRTKEELEAHVLPIVERRRAEPGDDLLSTLCTAEIDGVRMSDEEIKSFVSLLLAAGGETTDKAITCLVRNLLDHPGQLAAVRADRSLIDRAFAETMRYSPVVQMVMRQPDADVELSGGTIPAGSTVTCLLAAANRDPARYDRPDEFDLFRTDLDVARAFTAGANHTAFALGRHFCVGAQLARAEVNVGVGRLLDVAPDLRLAPGFTPVDTGVFTRAPERLLVEFTPAV
ncbi:cytochrome P450 [Microbispora corallina]|uniref:Cytochrome P450 n=1 Tax=Microbispora corallina TaxID=83302 RepID=A0ABQ4FXZ1_9ACTN|nr:cytochrome P450 [Microbispora corallina]GIH39618.1 cytochrome P450 [Microbispora corallina]